MVIHVWPIYVVLINLILNLFEVENIFTYSVALITFNFRYFKETPIRTQCFRTRFHSTSGLASLQSGQRAGAIV